MKVIIFTALDGTLNVVTPAPEMFDPLSKTRALVPELNDKTEDEILTWIANKDVPQGITYRIIDKTILPNDRTFRNAWIDNGTTITHDLVKAKNIKRDFFRVIRKPLLAALDAQYLKADEAGDTALKQAIAAKKQELRDVTALTLPNTILALKAFMPDILKKTEDTI